MGISKPRNRAAAGALALTAAAILFLLPASQASAVTFDNACVNSLIPTQASLIPVTMTATASPNPVAPGGTVTLSNIQQQLAIPPAVFVAGYNAGVLTTGTNVVPVTDIHSVIAGTNTVEGTQTTNSVATTATTTITDPDGSPGTGDETATPGTVSATYADETWTAGASGTINFREFTTPPPVTTTTGGINITAVVAGIITVRFGCDPGEVVEAADPSTIVYTDPAATFANTVTCLGPTTISIDDQTVEEGGAATFAVSLEGCPPSQQVTVDFATSDGTATAPGDYTPTSGTLTFTAGVTGTQPVTVQTIDDAVGEAAETFFVNLSNITGDAGIVDAQGVGTILDNDQVVDAAGQVIVNGPTSSSKTSKSFVFKLSNIGTVPITVNPADVTSSVDVNGTTTGSVSVNSGTKTLNPGSSTRVKLVWSYDSLLASGDSVVFQACWNIAGDVDTTNNCGSATATAK